MRLTCLRRVWPTLSNKGMDGDMGGRRGSSWWVQWSFNVTEGRRRIWIWQTSAQSRTSYLQVTATAVLNDRHKSGAVSLVITHHTSLPKAAEPLRNASGAVRTKLTCPLSGVRIRWRQVQWGRVPDTAQAQRLIGCFHSSVL